MESNSFHRTVQSLQKNVTFVTDHYTQSKASDDRFILTSVLTSRMQYINTRQLWYVFFNLTNLKLLRLMKSRKTFLQHSNYNIWKTYFNFYCVFLLFIKTLTSFIQCSTVLNLHTPLANNFPSEECGNHYILSMKLNKV